MSEYKTCPFCKQEISKDSTKCSFCKRVLIEKLEHSTYRPQDYTTQKDEEIVQYPPVKEHML